MMRSLYSAVSGLKDHQTMMDVIGNNIANVNTPGFKASRVTFATMLSQTLKGAAAPTTTPVAQGGSNAAQVGLGAKIGAVDQIMSQGSAENTGKWSDMMIQGDGFFALDNGGQTVFTRAGNFSLDSQGNLVDAATGAYVMGKMPAGSTATVTSTIGGQSLTNINVTPNTYSSISVDQYGNITGVNSAGAVQPIGQVYLATFPNDAGLTNTGNNYYVSSNNSGISTTQQPGSGSAGTVVSGALEMSNVDLGQEMTNMIVAQRGFEANSRVITVTDSFLQTLVDLKRQ